MGKQISAIAYDEELQTLNEKGLSVKQLELVKEVFHSITNSTSNYIKANSLKRLLGIPLKETKGVMEYCDLEEDGFDEYDFVCMVSLFTQAETNEKLASIFKIFDHDNSQLINGNELDRLVNCILCVNNGGESVDGDQVQHKIDGIMEDFFLHSKELTLRDFQTIAKEDPDIRQAMETLGIFQMGKFSDDYIEGLEEELHRSEGAHSEIDPEKYKQIREGVDFKQKKSGLFEEQETEGGDQFMAVKPYLGTVKNSAPSNSREFKGNLDPPEMDMRLKYVHGYRAFDTRNNIYYVDDRHFMFHAAGVNVKMCTESSSNKSSSESALKQYFNVENSDDITAMAFNLKTKLAAFGQIGHKPLINIVNSMNMETEAILVGHLKKGIGHLAMDKNGDFLVGTAMNDDHDICIYDISSLQRNDNRGTKKCKLICKSRGTKDRVLALRFSEVQGDRTIFMGTRRDLYYIQWKEGKVNLKKVSGYSKDKKQGNICIGHLNGFDCVVGTKNGELQGIKGMSPAKYAKGHSRIVYAMCSSRDGNTLISGGGDGKIIIWGGKLQQLSSFAINENLILVNPRIRAISLSNSNKNLIVGTRGGQIVKVDFGTSKDRNFLVKKIILNSHHSDELWGLACHPSRPEYFTCGEDFLLAKWDLQTKKQTKSITLKYQAKVLAIHEKRNHVAVGCKNGRVLIYDSQSLKMIKEIKVCTKEISEMKYSPVCLENGSGYGKELLAIGAHNGKIYVYDSSVKYKRVAILKGHHSTITHIDFGLDGSFLQSNCTSYELLYFSLDNFKQNTRGASQLKDEAWGTWTCTFGWWVQGIYPPCSDGTDVNSVDRSSCGKYLITGDDFGTVKIFNNPALKKAAYKKYLGHSSHVTNVRFAMNDQYIISVGGHDKSIFEWENLTYNQKSNKKYGNHGNDLAYLNSQEEIGDADSDFENDMEMNSVFRNFKSSENDEVVEIDTNDGGLFEEEEEEAGDQFMAVKPFLGEVKNSQPSDFFYEKGMEDTPDENLKLYYANGYRCFDAKNTAKFSSNPDSVVFVTAALGVNLDIRNNSQTFFNKHEEDIISFDLHPNRRIAATGQMAAKGKSKMIDIFIWDIETKEVLANLKGFHIRAIKLIRFSPSGKYLLTYGLDDDHSLAVYDWAQERLVCSSKVDKKNVLESCFALTDDRKFLSIGSRHCKVWNFKGCNIHSARVSWPKRLRLENSKDLLKQEPLIACATFSDNSFVAGTYRGKMIQITNGNMGKAWQVHEGPLSVFNNCPKYKRFFTGGRDGKVVEFVYERNALKQNRIVIALSQNDSFSPGIKCLDSVNKKLLIGTRGSDLFVMDDFDKKMKLSERHRILTGHYSGELWGLAVHPSDKYFVSVGDDAVARLFDVVERRHIRSVQLPQKCRAAAYSNAGTRIIFAGYEGQLFLYNSSLEKEYQRVDTKLKRANQWVEDIKFSPDDRFVAFGHHGGVSKVIVYQMKNSKLSHYCNINAGLTSALLHLDWSKDSSEIVINSQAYELKFVNVHSKSVVRASGAKDIQWHTWTCKLGFPVQGIFPGVDGSDVNAVCRTQNEKLLATGDDFQLVKLFKYPSVTKKSEFKSYLGHSSHVTSLRFMMNDNFLVSVGGNDKTSIIWTTDFGSEHKKLTNSRQPLELKSSNQNWDDEDEFVHKKSIRHKYADEFEQEGYTNAKIENEVEEDKENQGGLFQEEEVDVGDEFMAVKPWLGAIKAPSDYLGFKSSQLSKPRVEIELDYVFGYRSKDCRNNLFLDMNRDSGTVLMYHAAALGICLDTESNTQNFLRGHKDDVISMDYHQKTGLIATGELGPKPRIILHNSNDYSTICQLRQGVTKGVSILKFSPSGRRLAAVCINDDNSIAIFETRNDPLNGNGWNMTCITKGDRKKIITLEWINEDEILTLGKRHAKGWRYKNGSIKGSSFRPSKTCDFVVGSGALRIKNTALVLAGAVNGELQIWKSGSIISTRKDHERALDAIYCQPNNLNVFMTGGRDSLINFYDQTTREHIGFLNINQIITEQSINNRVRSIQFDPQFGHLFIGTFSSEIWGIKNLDLKSSVSEAKRASKTNDPSGFKFSSFNFMKKSSKNKNGPKKINLLQFIELEGIETEQLMAGHYTPNLKWTNEVWGLDVLDQDRYVSVSDDATLRIWNSSTRKCEMSIQLDVDAKGNHLPKDPKTKDLQESCKLRAVAVSHNKKWAAVGCKDGTVRLVDLQSGKQVKVFKPRKRWIQAIRFSPDDSLLAVGSHDSKISVFSVKNPQKSHDSVPVFSRLSNLKKHRAFITHLDFSSDGRYIHSNCGGYELLFFDCYTGEQLTSGATMLRDETWHTWSCILGWPVQGVFQSGWDGSDVNMVDRSQIQHNGDRLLAAADDFSTIRVYKFPCLKNSAKSVVLEGHSSHVTNVKWGSEDRFLFSAGGEDQTIMQWRIRDN